ncbi:MAG: hypothetical protein DCC51_17080, partial [Anaerolineae bacterium]
YRWSQADQDGYPAEQWTPGEVILERLDLPVPPGTPPGEDGLYGLRIGRFDPATGERLPHIDAAGAFAGDSLLSDDVAILYGPPPNPLPVPPFAVDAPAAEGLRFMGYEPLPRAAETGEPLSLALWWAADEPLPSLQLRLSLVDEAGAIVELGRGQPAYNTYPFDQWQTPAFVIDRQQFHGGWRDLRRRDCPARLHHARGGRAVHAGTGVAGDGATVGQLYGVYPRVAAGWDVLRLAIRRHATRWRVPHDALAAGGGGGGCLRDSSFP